MTGLRFTTAHGISWVVENLSIDSRSVRPGQPYIRIDYGRPATEEERFSLGVEGATMAMRADDFPITVEVVP